MGSLFKIEKLRQFASFALDSSDYQPADSARVRAVPDVRTIRYYTTIGLIDRPAEMRGRTAMYSLRHVEQLVAIKRLQAEGLTLSDIQHRLIGMPAKELKRLAKLPGGIEKKFSSLDPAPATKTAQPPPKQPQPSASQAAEPSDELWNRVPQSRRPPISGSNLEKSKVKRIVRLQISSGVSIDVALDDKDIADFDLPLIEQSAQPLLKELQRQQRISNRQFEGEAPYEQ